MEFDFYNIGLTQQIHLYLLCDVIDDARAMLHPQNHKTWCVRARFCMCVRACVRACVQVGNCGNSRTKVRPSFVYLTLKTNTLGKTPRLNKLL